jgi:hypothetical protein
MLKLHAGVSKKVGLPGFSSASASCTIEAELDSSLLQDHEGFQIVVQRAYQSCEQAVQDQIARLTNDGQSDDSQPNTQPQEMIEVRTSPAIRGVTVTARGAETRETNRAVFRDAPSHRPATASQVKAIRAIAARRKIDLVGMLRERFGLTTADELGIRQASNLIDELKGDGESSPSMNGTGAYATTGGARCLPGLNCCRCLRPRSLPAPTRLTKSLRNSPAGTT